MKVLVTGVGGQLGHDVMNELARRGYEGIGSDIAPALSNAFALSYSQFVPGNTGINTVGCAILWLQI